MVRHSVYFWLDDSLSDEQKQQLEGGLRALFDIEVVFMYPWAVEYRNLSQAVTANGSGNIDLRTAGATADINVNGVTVSSTTGDIQVIAGQSILTNTATNTTTTARCTTAPRCA